MILHDYRNLHNELIVKFLNFKMCSSFICIFWKFRYKTCFLINFLDRIKKVYICRFILFCMYLHVFCKFILFINVNGRIVKVYIFCLLIFNSKQFHILSNSINLTLTQLRNNHFKFDVRSIYKKNYIFYIIYCIFKCCL